jgi:Holliday junction resolvase RusA-like endonuclease
MKFVIPFEVCSASRPRVTKYGTFYGKTYTAFREVVGAWVKAQGYPLLKGPGLKVTGTFYMHIPKSWSKKKTLEADGKYRVGRGDLDNEMKSVFDILQGVLFENDSMIVQADMRKVWTTKNGSIELVFEEVDAV